MDKSRIKDLLKNMNIDPTLPMIEYYYVVKDILDKREQDGKVEYLVQWDSTWEPEHRIYCPSLIEKFENKKREEEQQAMNGEENTTSDEDIISVGDETMPQASAENSTPDINNPEDDEEPDEFIDIIYRNGLYYFVLLWKGSNKATLVPIITGNILYPELVKKYLAANDSN